MTTFCSGRAQACSARAAAILRAPADAQMSQLCSRRGEAVTKVARLPGSCQTEIARSVPAENPELTGSRRGGRGLGNEFGGAVNDMRIL